MAYSAESDAQKTPDEFQLKSDLATVLVWDNNDAEVETLDGKGTLHATVGHTYQNIESDKEDEDAMPATFREGRNRRKFVGKEREIPPFRKSLSRAKFTSATCTDSCQVAGCKITLSRPTKKVYMTPLDFYWF